MNILTQKILIPNKNVELYIRREDLIHPYISGNKFRKLKYNIEEAQKLQKKTLLSFGGAYSNHIAALAYAGKLYGFNTIGVIRGEELENNFSQNPTLQFAVSCGMQLYFVSRDEYRNKSTTINLEKYQNIFGDFYLVPEGGTNSLAVKGCQEILTETDSKYDFICTAVGTGGTISGLINSSFNNQKVLGFPALKGDFLDNEIAKYATKTNWKLISDYHFGGYGKVSRELINFLNLFYKQNNIPLDPVYTGKMVFGILDLLSKDYFPKGSKILIIHTGGLQGITGMNQTLKLKNLPTINYYV
ncbi:1-aminocyclopropane-1-carboxylate deaminase/D-cysteine desulfhydrase [Flavobacterium croceum]|uniref:1-aminocyclopropane-1-carboxylate deaminase/D-cysteine desulfhydrase n=1 Tax=Flavobacterium croceum TaxID=370975 RepID=UPI0024A8CBA7|nr:pyridoxal-phosphate dependent enzyme [Flavobacterium croceum]